MVDLKAYKEWKDLFNENISNVWQEEPIPVLKKISMLLVSIKKEIKKIEDKVEKDISNLRKNVIDNKHTLLEIQSRRRSNNDKENVQVKNTKASFSQSRKLSVDSPDIFLNVEAPVLGCNDSSSIIISDEENTVSTFISESPEIKRKKRNHASQKRSQRMQRLRDNNASTIRGLNNSQNDVTNSKQSSQQSCGKMEETNVTNDKSSMDFIKGLIGHTQASIDPFKKNHNEQNLVLTPVRSECDGDVSIVQCTPVQITLPKRKDKTLHLSKRKCRKEKTTTLTQIFSRQESAKLEETRKRLQVTNYDSDETYFDPTQGIKTSKSGSLMGITRMVSYLNTYSPPKNDDNVEGKAQGQGLINLDPDTQQIADIVEDIRFEDFENDTTLNSAIIEENEEEEIELNQGLNEFLANAQNVPDHQLEAEPVVRGKARRNLPGWSCKDCEKFYLKQGLNPGEILALNKCSRHRGSYRPREDTLPGFWDMNIITQDTKNTQ